MLSGMILVFWPVVKLHNAHDNDTTRNGSPILVTLVSFWHFTIVRQQVLTPSIAFTSVSLLS